MKKGIKMNRWSFSFLLMFFNLSNVYAREIYSKIMSIMDHHSDKKSLVLLGQGEVLKANFAQTKLLVTSNSTLWREMSYRFSVDSDNNLISFSPVSLKNHKMFMGEKMPFKNLNYRPSSISDDHLLQELFNSSKKNYLKDSQCFHRAHVWTYEWRKNLNLFSQKSWLFFTPRFIRENNFKWWFHVAPMVLVKKDEKLKRRVLDIKYAKAPLPIKEWTEIFVKNDSNCTEINQYSEYVLFPESNDCYIMTSSMYEYIPLDLERSELEKMTKTKWHKAEVNESYTLGFFDKSESSNEE